MKLGVDLQPDLHTSMQTLACSALKHRLEHQPLCTPALRLGTGNGHALGSVGGLVLNQLHVAMATTLTALRKLCLNPIFSVEGTLDGLPYQRIQLK